jgi:hypothetical protein
MAQSAQLTWALLLIGAALTSLCTAREWAARPDPLLTLVTGGLVGLACALVAAAMPG